MREYLFVVCQYLLPQKLLSRLAGYLADCQVRWVRNGLIHWFIGRYRVDLSIAAETDPAQYRHFNDFFTRPLATGQRPVDPDDKAIVCPADGCISQLGKITEGRIFQAKGREYSLLELVGGSHAVAQPFANGLFATVYLAPRDYHRVHMPFGGILKTMIHVPGDLFSVNDATARNVPRLFARNERLICLFKTDIGPMAVILVGAMIVASIETTWAGLVTPADRRIRRWHYSDEPVKFNKGEEMGRFKLGSTTIVLLGEKMAAWQRNLMAQTPVKMGERLATIQAK